MQTCLKFTIPTLALLLALNDAQAIKHRPSREATQRPEVLVINGRSADGHRSCEHTGVLIAPTVVLTAAHCVRGFDLFDVMAPYAKGRPVRGAARTARVHPDFQPGQIENDLAVIILKESLDVGAELPSLHGGDLYPLETPLWVLGRVKNGSITAKQVFEGPVTLVSFPGNINLYGGSPQTVEKGDSGGPLYVEGKRRTIVGVVSGILEFSRWNVPTDAYVPITRKNREWIQQQIPVK